MKKVYFIIVFIIIVMVLVSCNQKENMIDKNNTDENTDMSEDNTVDDDENTDMSEDNTVNDNETSSGVPSVPVMVVFSSVEDIDLFVSAANGTISQFESFAGEQNLSGFVTHDIAKDIANNINTGNMVKPKSGVLIEDSGGTYYVERSELDFCYYINGIRYRFIYRFNATEPYEYEGQPVISGISFGSSLLDLYQGQMGFVGSVMQGTTVITVVVNTEQAENVDLGSFELCEYETDAVIK